MDEHKSATLWRLLAAGTCLVACGAPRAMAVPAVQDVLGTWHGFYQSFVNPDDRAPILVQITDQRQRRFIGTATITDGTFPFAGTIAASGEFTLVGGAGGFMLRAHGVEVGLGDGSVRFARMMYQFKSPGPGGGLDDGLIIVVCDTAFADAANVLGTWDGTYHSSVNPDDTGPLSVAVTSQEGSTFGGQMMVNGLVFDLVGTIAMPPPGEEEPPDPCVIVGLGPAGWFVVVGRLHPGDPTKPGGQPPMFVADYQLFFADGSMDAGSFDLVQQIPDPG